MCFIMAPADLSRVDYISAVLLSASIVLETKFQHDLLSAVFIKRGFFKSGFFKERYFWARYYLCAVFIERGFI